MKLKWWITIEQFMKSKRLANITPGEILEEDFLKPMALKPIPAGEGHWRAGAAHQ